MRQEIPLADILPKIAAHLGAKVEWVEGIDHGAHLIHPEWKIWFHADEYHNKLNVSISYERNAFMQVSTQDLMTYEERFKGQGDITSEISCGASRPPIDIAKDIARRLLPTAKELHARYRKLMAQRIEEKNRKLQVAERFTSADYRLRNDDCYTLLPKDNSLPNIRIGTDSVHFDTFDCSVETALKILELLKND